jgi:hypothetical protein
MIIQIIWLELDLIVRWMGRSLSTGLLKRERHYELLHEYLNVGDYKGWTGLSLPAAYPSTVEHHHIQRFQCT